MRVTTQMLNDSSRRAGLPVNNTSLLNYVNGGGSSKNTLTQALNSKSSAKVNSADKAKYEKMEKSAEKLGKQADKFTAEGADSLFGKAKEAEDYEAVYKAIEDMVSQYNSTIAILESAPGAMNDFYRQSMQELASDHRDALNGIGISCDKRGKLQVDREKLEAADRETVEKVLGKDGKFTSKLSFLAGRVADNAESHAVSSSRGYSASGDITGAYRNRYDHKG